MKKAIVLAGSRGIGKAVAESLQRLDYTVVATSSRDLDTSDVASVEAFIAEQKQTDVLVLNTGGPPAKNFADITREDWDKYYHQLFLSFCLILQKLKVNDGGYIFLISSFNIKEPNAKLILSNAYRLAFVSVLRSLTKDFAAREVSCINIAPGPVKTDRLFGLVDDMDAFEKTLPMQRAGRPEEIGGFVKGLIENNVKYLTGVSINFDGGVSSYVL